MLYLWNSFWFFLFGFSARRCVRDDNVVNLLSLLLSVMKIPNGAAVVGLYSPFLQVKKIVAFLRTPEAERESARVLAAEMLRVLSNLQNDNNKVN